MEGVCNLPLPDSSVGAYAAALRKGAMKSSFEETGVSSVTERSTRETFVTGTRIEMPGEVSACLRAEFGQAI